MGHKKYMLVGDVEVPYEHPHMTLWKQLFSIDFYVLSVKNILPEANHRQYSQSSHFQYGSHEKMPKY